MTLDRRGFLKRGVGLVAASMVVPAFLAETARVLESGAPVASAPAALESLAGPIRQVTAGLGTAGRDGRVPEMQGRIIISGGEVLVPQIREPILYPALGSRSAARAVTRDR